MVAFLFCHSYPQMFCIIRLSNTNNWRKCWFSHSFNPMFPQGFFGRHAMTWRHLYTWNAPWPFKMPWPPTQCFPRTHWQLSQPWESSNRPSDWKSGVSDCMNEPRDRMGPLHFIMYMNLGEITTDSWGNLKEVSSTRINSAWWIVDKTSQNCIIWANLHENEW